MLLEIILGVVLLVAFVAEVVLTETEHFGWATALLLLCGGACYYFNVYGAALWVKAHVAQTLIFVGCYLVAGVVWSFIKWFSYLVGYREKWREAKEEDKKMLPSLIIDARRDIERSNERNKRQSMAYPHVEFIEETTPTNDEEWLKYFSGNYSYRLASHGFSKPLASDNKAKITAWMAFWPFSFLGTFINDPIRRLFNFIFSSFKKLYQRMSDHLFKDLEPKSSEEHRRDPKKMNDESFSS